MAENLLSSVSREAILHVQTASGERAPAVVIDTPEGKLLRYPPGNDGKTCEVFIPHTCLEDEVDCGELHNELERLIRIRALEDIISSGAFLVPEEDAKEVATAMAAIMQKGHCHDSEYVDVLHYVLAYKEAAAPVGSRYQKAVPAYLAAFAEEERRIRRLSRRKKRGKKSR